MPGHPGCIVNGHVSCLLIIDESCNCLQAFCCQLFLFYHKRHHACDASSCKVLSLIDCR